MSESSGLSNTGKRADLNNADPLAASQMFRNPAGLCTDRD